MATGGHRGFPCARFWFVGGTDAQAHARAEAEGTVNLLPSNHSPRFAPVLDPTLKVGLQALLGAASAWLCAPPPAGRG